MADDEPRASRFPLYMAGLVGVIILAVLGMLWGMAATTDIAVTFNISFSLATTGVATASLVFNAVLAGLAVRHRRRIARLSRENAELASRLLPIEREEPRLELEEGRHDD